MKMTSVTRRSSQRFQSRFSEEGPFSEGFSDKDRKVRFKRLVSEKRKASYLKLLVLLAAAAWAYIYFTNFK